MVTPGAKRSELIWTDEGIRVRVAARAVEGKANTALVGFLADRLGVPPSRVRLLHGLGSRRKVVEIAGLTAEEIQARLTR